MPTVHAAVDFAREVQPVLNHHCLPCHQGTVPPDLRGDRLITDWSSMALCSNSRQWMTKDLKMTIAMSQSLMQIAKLQFQHQCSALNAEASHEHYESARPRDQGWCLASNGP